MSANRHSRTRASRGFTLLEVLVAVLILSVGLLGFAASLGVAVRATQSANYRTQATNLAYAIIDRIRANRNSFPEYVSAFGNAASSYTGTTMAQTDLAGWKSALDETLPNGQGSITFAANVVTVRVRWQDERWAAADGNTATGDDTFLVSSSL